MHAPIKKDPYEEASMKGFKPYQPYVELPSTKALIIMPKGYKFLRWPNSMMTCSNGSLVKMTGFCPMIVFTPAIRLTMLSSSLFLLPLFLPSLRLLCQR